MSVESNVSGASKEALSFRSDLDFLKHDISLLSKGRLGALENFLILQSRAALQRLVPQINTFGIKAGHEYFDSTKQMAEELLRVLPKGGEGDTGSDNIYASDIQELLTDLSEGRTRQIVRRSA